MNTMQRRLTFKPNPFITFVKCPSSHIKNKAQMRLSKAMHYGVRSGCKSNIFFDSKINPEISRNYISEINRNYL